MLVFVAALLLHQGGEGGGGGGGVRPLPRRADRPDLRAGLDTLYAGSFPEAAQYFAPLAARDTSDAAPLIFQAGAFIWWAAAKDSDVFAQREIDSLLDRAIQTARSSAPGLDHDFWLATAIGYRARERELHGHSWSAAKDAKAMRDGYARVLAADSSCNDCWLGLGLYSYGLARASALARLVSKIIGLGSGNAAEGLAMLRRAATQGDLARVEATWVLAAALSREAARDPTGRPQRRADPVAVVVRPPPPHPAEPAFPPFLL